MKNVNLDHLKLAVHKIDQINEKIKEVESHPSLIRNPSYYTVILYVLITLVIIIILTKIYKYVKGNGPRDEGNCAVRVINLFCPSNQSRPEQQHIVEYVQDTPSATSYTSQTRSPSRIAARRTIRPNTELGSSFNLNN